MLVNEIQRTINGLGAGTIPAPVPYSRWLPYNPGAITRGLGDVPNDFEASVDLQYIPVRQGWYYGYPVNGSGYPDARGLGVAMEMDPNGQARWKRYGGLADATSDTAVQQISRAERVQTILQVISTLSIATMATLAIARAISTRHSGQRPFLGEDE